MRYRLVIQVVGSLIFASLKHQNMPQCRIKNFKKISVIQFLHDTQASHPLIAASFFASIEHQML
jgi:hypothetical protein